MQTIPASVQKREQLLLNLIFFVFAGLLLLFRVLTFIHVNLQVVDSDQPFMWIGASDYAKGHFYEPRFYGQNYNTFMEALFAVPFMWSGMPVYAALPLATHLLFLAPFAFASLFLFRKRKHAEATLVLVLLCCFPAEFDILTALPRGFVTGIALCSFCILSIHSPTNLKYTVLNTLLAVTAFFVNPNSVIVTVPVLLFVFLHNYRSRNYYLASLLCLLCAWPLHVFFNGFYSRHPELVIYGYEFSLTTAEAHHFVRNMLNGFVHLGLFRVGMPLFTFLVMLLLAVQLWRQNRRGFYTCLVFLAGIAASSFTPKVADGAHWPFYSYSRMFLGVPLMLALLLSLTTVRKQVFWVIIALGLAFSAWKVLTYRSAVQATLEKDRWLGVHLVPMPAVLDAIAFYRQKCTEYGVKDLVISNVFWLSTYLCYGGPAVDHDYPDTFETDAERRYRVKAAAKRKFPERFIFISCQGDFEVGLKKPAFRLTRLDDYGLYLVEENRLSLKEFADLSLRTETCRE